MLSHSQGQSLMKRSTFAMSGSRPEADAAGLAFMGFDPSRFAYDIWQVFAMLLPVRTVGVAGDGRPYD